MTRRRPSIASPRRTGQRVTVPVVYHGFLVAVVRVTAPVLLRKVEFPAIQPTQSMQACEQANTQTKQSQLHPRCPFVAALVCATPPPLFAASLPQCFGVTRANQP